MCDCGRFDCPLASAEARAEWQESQDPRSCPNAPLPEQVQRDRERSEESAQIAKRLIDDMRQKTAGVQLALYQRLTADN